MEIGLRILALAIDAAFCFGSLPLVLVATGSLLDKCGGFGMVLIPFWLVMFVLWPLLYMAIPTAIWGRSLGKLICRLSVTDFLRRPPGLWRVLAREVLKFLAIGSLLGAVLTLFYYYMQGTTWYDNVCGTQVSYSPYLRQTKTQKNWHKTYKRKLF